MANCYSKSSIHQEFNHDGTYKTLLSLIGQESLAQSVGGKHVAHTFLGLTGAVAGISLKRAEGPECFREASKEVLPERARWTVRWIGTDALQALEGPLTLELDPICQVSSRMLCI